MDIHPRPDHSQVEVWVGGKSIELGRLNETSLIQTINAAHLTLASVVWDGYFVYEEMRSFDFLYHFDSVDDCESFLAKEDWDTELDPATASRARDLLADGEGELLIREPARAARLRRS